jgi:hypothetical protein
VLGRSGRIGEKIRLLALRESIHDS